MKSRKTWLIAAALILALLCSACQKQTQAAVEKDETKELIKKENIYPFDAGIIVAGLARLDDTLLVAGQSDTVRELAFMDIAQDKPQLLLNRSIKLSLPETFAEIKAVCAGQDGLFYVLFGEMPPRYYDKHRNVVENEDYQGRYLLQAYDESGALLSEKEIKDWPFDDASGVLADKDGRLYIYDAFYLARLDSEAELLDFIQLDELEISSAALSKGELLLSCYDYSAGSPLYYRADMDAQSLSELSIELPAEDPQWIMGNSGKSQGLGEEWILGDAFCFFAYDAESGKSEKLMKWGFTHQYETRFDYIMRLSDKLFVCSEWDKESISLIWSETVPNVELPVVNVAICGDRASEMQGRVEEFENLSGEYNYEFTVYSEAEIDLLITRMGSGDIPDLVLFEYCLNTTSMQFDDLYSYIDNDPELSRASFIPNLLSSLEVKGELHELWTSVRIPVLLAFKEDAEIISQMTADEFFQYAQGESERLVFSTAQNIESFARDAATEFLEANSGECRFDDENFAIWLELLKLLPDRDTDFEKYINMDSVLTSASFPNLETCEDRLSSPEAEYVLVNHPFCPSGGDYYSCGAAGRAVAIPRGSQNKPGA